MGKPRQARKQLYIWQNPDWPNLQFDLAGLVPSLDAARKQQARLLGQIEAIGLSPRQELLGDLWVQDTLATAAIEGEHLDMNAVRSSVHRRLRLTVDVSRDRSVEGLVDILQDASTNYLAPLSEERLGAWQAALFPTGRSGLHKIVVGRYRDHSDAMEIVSGLPGREVVHYTAPPSEQVAKEMRAFLAWFETTKPRQGQKLGKRGFNPRGA